MATQTSAPPKLSHVLETVLYTKDINASRHFYSDILGLSPIPGMSSPRGQGYMLGHGVLLIFVLGKTTEDLILDPARPDNLIPRHAPSEHIIEILKDDAKAPPDATSNALRQHYCFAVETVDEVKAWERYLREQKVDILSVMEWEKGARSVYFKDPDEHVGEILSRGIWPNW